MTTAKRLTLATVNKAVAAAVPGAELVKGEGYFYFIGAGFERAKSASVYVPRLNDLSLERWVEEAKSIHAEIEEPAPAGTFKRAIGKVEEVRETIAKAGEAMAVAAKVTNAAGRALAGVKMADLHPTPWRVRGYRKDHVRQEVRVWNGLDKRADGFEVYDAAGETVETGFRNRQAAVGWALVNVAA